MTEQTTFTVQELLSTELPKISWIVQGCIPIGLTIIAGKPKVGKSILGLQLASAVTAGTPFLGHFAVESRRAVLHVALEDTPRRLQERVSKLEVAHDADLRFVLRDQIPSDFYERCDLIDRWLNEHTGGLVVIDTLARFRGSGGRRRYDDDVEFGGIFQEIAFAHDGGIVLIHHERKQIAADWLDSPTGTLGIVGSADAVVALRKPERSSPDATLLMTGRDIEDAAIAIRLDSAALRWMFVGEAAEAHLSHERRLIIEWLRLVGKPASPAEIAAAVQLPHDSVRQLVRKLAADGLIRSVSSGRYVYVKPEERF